ncbi:unnamed protein product [Adineta steineri]|uniref:Uncharacterized protein n=1 Tax=Adineta steineri TaxID=433720 RepID=A0A813QMR5_9BILA|nr:unnamed protein product [Adineta steineri]CAF0777881.1 unnamed protein product [Adineta steineri]CAF3649371.1 unnamed protein product [Adineta steineri]CAF3742929.1 unnamed protein product [Adineta steineri]CAF3916514.1 unnamed protein product [Adineta steineri]
MLQSFTQLLFQRNITMAFHSRKLISLIHNTQISARPFDEILYSYGSSSSTTNYDHSCLNPTLKKDSIT